MLERLLKDITSAWRTRGSNTGLLIKVTGADLTFGDTSAADRTIVTGPLPAVVEWAAGRGSSGVATAGPAAAGPAVPGGSVPVAPKWI